MGNTQTERQHHPHDNKLIELERNALAHYVSSLQAHYPKVLNTYKMPINIYTNSFFVLPEPVMVPTFPFDHVHILCKILFPKFYATQHVKLALHLLEHNIYLEPFMHIAGYSGYGKGTELHIAYYALDFGKQSRANVGPLQFSHFQMTSDGLKFAIRTTNTGNNIKDLLYLYATNLVSSASTWQAKPKYCDIREIHNIPASLFPEPVRFQYLELGTNGQECCVYWRGIADGKQYTTRVHVPSWMLQIEHVQQQHHFQKCLQAWPLQLKLHSMNHFKNVTVICKNYKFE